MLRLLRTASSNALKGIALLRLDFNTQDNWRLRAVMPTLKFLSRHAEKIVILSHRGRPPAGLRANGRPRTFKKGLSLRRSAGELKKVLRRPVDFIPHFNFERIREEIRRAPRGSIFLLENIRYLPGESENSQRTARVLATLGDYYVNDAFAVSHRVNASVVAITKFLPSYAGLELEREIKLLSKVMRRPRRPLVLVLGGGKASDKLGVIRHFERTADFFLLGGAAANTMLYLRGMDVRESMIEENERERDKLKPLLRMKNLILPVDFAWGRKMILDIGPETRLVYADILRKARTIIWSGPLGFIEKSAYAKGSIAIARVIARHRASFSVAGGGETVMFLKRYSFDWIFDFISAGGGAMLEFLAGKKLPGIGALQKNRPA